MRFLISTLIAAAVVAPFARAHNPFAFFHPTVVVGPADLDALAAGAALVRILPASGTEIGAFTATTVARHVTIDRASAWMHQVELLRENRYVMASQRLSTPPRLSDFDRLTLDDEDLEEIRRCVPGRCGVKLSATDMATLKAAAAGGPGWKPIVQRAFRERLLRRVEAFSARGHAALEDLADKKRPVSPAGALAPLVARTEFLGQAFPDIAHRLGCANAAAGTSFLYWSKERLGGKPVITITHVQMMAGGERRRPPLVMVGTQLYASHYLDASLTVTAFLPDGPDSPAYFVYLHRSSVDLLGGFWGGVTRSIIESKVRKDGPAILRSVGARLAGGDPPTASTRHAWPSR